MAEHGGKREGAGRPKGAKDKLTRETSQELSKLARCYTERALNTLVNVMEDVEATPTARVAAANAILDRAHGKPMQPVDVAVDDNLSSLLKNARKSAGIE